MRAERIIFTEHFRGSEIPAEVLEQCPLLVDPVNRYQNLLELAPLEFFDTFVGCASKSLERLQALLSLNPIGDVESMALIELFRPQCGAGRSFTIVDPFEGGFNGGWIPLFFINHNSLAYDEALKQRHFAAIMLTNLSSFVNLYVWRFPKATDEEMMVNVHKVVDMLRGVDYRPWVPGKDRHDSRTYTFYVPFRNGTGFRISFNEN